MKVFASYNLKGGVGKTATAVNLAYLSATEGHRTLLWDLDPQASATFYLRVKPRVKGGAKRLLAGKTDLDRRIRGSDFEGLDLLPADFSYRKMDLRLGAAKNPARRIGKLLATLADQYDHVFLDCAPNISLLSESVFRAADVLLVPTIPSTLSVRTLEVIRTHLRACAKKGMFKGKPPRLLPFFCMVDRRKRMHRDTVEAAKAEDPSFLTATIPNSSAVERMGVERAPVDAFARNSSPARAFRALWREIMDEIGAP